MKKILLLIALLFLTGCASSAASHLSIDVIQQNIVVNSQGDIDDAITEPTDMQNEIEDKKEVVIIKEIDQIEDIKRENILDNFDQNVTFVPQAPFAIWDYLHDEACEEASMIMAVKHYNGESLDAIIMEREIQALVAWEEEREYNVDLTALETKTILKEYFGFDSTISTEVTVKNIKEILQQEKLILVPAAGRLLGNPNFHYPGPIFHMLMIRGFDEDEFITNDPGTRNGEGFKYKYDVLLAAIHNWNHGLAEGGMSDNEMNSGKKVMIIVERP
ncbi:C39 family peptidase [Patescibacteria group bacterium]|nr:C39 family peptidase [Patescibacteria group bacterium]